MDDEMMPCPFCGADMNQEHDYADYILSPNLVSASKHCWKCGASGPSVFTDEDDWQAEADSLWNKRAG